MKRKVTVTTGTRAEYGILRPILREIRKSKNLELHLLVAGTHLSKKYGYTINEIKSDGFSIHGKIRIMPNGNEPYHMSIALGKGVIQFSKIFKKIKPDINIILGDRDESLASALAASHMNIPNAHIHGGDVSQGLDEYIRHAITKLSNIHFAATKKSKERILRMGEDPKRVILTGSPSIDEVAQSEISAKKELEKKYDIDLSKPLFLLVQHSITSEYEKSKEQIQQTLNALVKLRHQTISILPNSDAGHTDIVTQLKKHSKKYDFKTYPSLPRKDYLGLMKYCTALVGNSSSGLIEGSYLNTSVVNIGSRQMGREHGRNVIFVKKFSETVILQALKKSLKMKSRHFKNNYIYGNGNASKKIVKFLEKLPPNEELINKQLTY
ncbi:MAG: UDP-N-acetylglucosamine 2-epimerase (hydrolyzing) [Nitrosopumilaceae archaeon]|nr:UDP-N-acetylglucosamine 2-epimerase (hydrolyzing) [Nitrosopumilaceae archaeon]NIU01391.1 UDP-N-acetylglucosamine 2-epimerase (hydrolyzing) [Nitrosopumilaceae archaeon]NIU87749.1 UDP-N-acetylglucosamine 2-epimerase (hydrolyzing) [Nitrosopumilaceae archaeon]NIV66127.1 UDP-N-acetylglucosamine 2-epimerase (hydrolyzing) [Nitrosopumilaceae archaeon]NIX61993.1 UDP-N-acetylglucosamine 2-epimerase (hydrolyzing) [Nitrosopumilaceae archaeon]